MALTGQIGIHAQLTYTGTAVLGAAPTYPLAYTKYWDVTSGTGANQADVLYSAARTLSTAATEDLDLAGALATLFGATITAAKVKAVIIESVAANTTNLTIGNATSNQFQGFFGAVTHTIVLKPGEAFAFLSPAAAGLAVTAGTGDLLKVANAAGASATYNIIVVATTA